MVTTPIPPTEQDTIAQHHSPKITWESLPDDFQLDDEPVENTGQPLIAGALRESLELAGYIQSPMLIAGNLGICATMDGNVVIKAPDWLYIAAVLFDATAGDRRSYTPNLEGEIPKVVMEFLSDTDGNEYSAKQTYPPGKWFFYEQILQVPTYVLFHPATGSLDVQHLENGHYKIVLPDENGRYWLADMALFLGIWQGEKEGRNGFWLRWWDESGTLLPWAMEQLDAERQKVEAERQRADRLAERLRSLGIDPSEV